MQSTNSDSSRLTLLFVISLLLHIIFLMGLSLVPKKSFPVAAQSVEVELRPSSEPADVPKFVRTDDVPEKLLKKEILDKAKLVSDRLMRVEKEMKAKQLGRTQNTQQANAQEVEVRKETRKANPESVSKRFLSTESWEQTASKSALQSRVGIHLPDSIGFGEMTALNVDRFTYSSFFLRFEDLVRYRWEKNLYQAIMSTPSAVLMKTLDPRWRTDIEVQLAPNGELKKVIVFKEAGIPAFDSAIVMALKEARFFPNPPRELVDAEDGLIHLRFGFLVHADPRAISKQ